MEVTIKFRPLLWFLVGWLVGKWLKFTVFHGKLELWVNRRNQLLFDRKSRGILEEFWCCFKIPASQKSWKTSRNYHYFFFSIVLWCFQLFRSEFCKWHRNFSRITVEKAVDFSFYLVVDGNFPYCGGTIIGPSTILTAAHCLYEVTDTAKVKILVAEHDLKISDETTRQ